MTSARRFRAGCATRRPQSACASAADAAPRRNGRSGRVQGPVQDTVLWTIRAVARSARCAWSSTSAGSPSRSSRLRSSSAFSSAPKRSARRGQPEPGEHHDHRRRASPTSCCRSRTWTCRRRTGPRRASQRRRRRARPGSGTASAGARRPGRGSRASRTRPAGRRSGSATARPTRRHESTPWMPSASPIHFSTCGPRISRTATSRNAPPMQAAITSAVSRFLTNGRLSLRS